ncbi:hypothetical protein CRG98_019165, partial [Punica granatum]
GTSRPPIEEAPIRWRRRGKEKRIDDVVISGTWVGARRELARVEGVDWRERPRKYRGYFRENQSATAAVTSSAAKYIRAVMVLMEKQLILLMVGL